VVEGVDATTAAFEVGYESVSQFNREYSRLFGQPPMRDARTARSLDVQPVEAVGEESIRV
jgi:AraC-like DNA-binding protein